MEGKHKSRTTKAQRAKNFTRKNMTFLDEFGGSFFD